MKYLYEIADISIVSNFKVEYSQTKFLKKGIEQGKSIYLCHNKFEKDALGIYKFSMLNKNDKFYLSYKNEIAIINSMWNRMRISIESEDDFMMIFLKVFYNYAVRYHNLIFHSSIINYMQYGILFLGPSGIGKTTQAELWNKYRDALIINGDIVFVQETEENFLGWGTPWHGSSPYCENTSVPVHAMIVLKQESENSIRELTGFEKVTAVSNNVFYPQWLENGMELCLETLDHLLSAIPVYELSCRPDEEAVRLTEETLFGN